MAQEINTFIEQVTVLDITAPVARRAGEMRAQLQGGGQARTQADMLIAATAQVHGLTVVTRNVSDFEATGVRLVNPWLQASA